MREFYDRVYQFVWFLWGIKKDLWLSTKKGGLHWHFFAFDDMWAYDIAFEELHKAQKKYEERINKALNAKNKKRGSNGRFT